MKKSRRRRKSADDVYIQAIVIQDKDSDLNEVHVCVGSPDIGRLKEGIWSGFQVYIVDKHIKRSDFSGKVVFTILSEITPQSPGLWRAMADLEEHLKAVVKVGCLQTVTVRPVQIEFTYTSREDASVR